MKKLVKLKTILIFFICICTVFFCSGCTHFFERLEERFEYELENFGVDSENIGIDDYLELKDSSFFGGDRDGYDYKVNENVFFSINAVGNGGYVYIYKTNFEEGTDIRSVNQYSEKSLLLNIPRDHIFMLI